MSAYLAPEDKDWLKNQLKTNHISLQDQVLLFQLWDTQTDYDVAKSVKDMSEVKQLRRFALHRLLTYPIDFILGYALLNKLTRKYNFLAVKLYVKFLFNRISLDNFRKELQSLKKDVKLL